MTQNVYGQHQDVPGHLGKKKKEAVLLYCLQ
jgi:hypothetical protein